MWENAFRVDIIKEDGKYQSLMGSIPEAVGGADYAPYP